MLVASVLLFLLINGAGARLTAPAAAVAATRAPTAVAQPGIFVHVLIALIAVVAAGQVLGRLCQNIGQPSVIGEVIAGILLGPSLLGRVWPEASAFILPAEVGPFIAVISQVGVILYMFLVGLELNPAVLREHAGKTLFISHASIAVPFLAGAGLGLFL
jgi:Kef-type K+ transport system membrane component KefB